MLDTLNPFIRYARLQYILHNRVGRCIAIDHRLFYVKSNEALIVCDREYHLNAGSAIFIPAVTPYEIRAVQDRAPIMVFDFDLTSEFSVFRESFHTIELAHFNADIPFRENLLPGFEAVREFSDAGSAEGMLSRVIEQFSDDDAPYRCETASACFKMALLSMLSDSHAAKSPAVRMACDYIRKNYAGEMTCEEVARAVGYHPNHLYRLFRQQMGTGLQEYIIAYRIREAKKLLCDPGLSIVDAAISCGFTDASYFSQCFRRHVGMTPREYKRQSMLP